MLIQVVYQNNKYDYVKDFILDKLIEEKKIVKFLRKSGWATLGVDPIRTGKNEVPHLFWEKRGHYNQTLKRAA